MKILRERYMMSCGLKTFFATTDLLYAATVVEDLPSSYD